MSLQGKPVRVLVKKWGNSASVRIPASVMAATDLRLDQEVEVREEKGRIIIDPIRPAKYTLADLIAGITDENRHDEIDFGPPVGKEIL
jgi:antitoxin MazE